MTDDSKRAKFLDYHKSIAVELNAIKNRVRNLIPNHWATDGGFKEAALRQVIRRHLPESLQVGTGFIVDDHGNCSTQIDILIVDRAYSTLFKEGDSLIVAPDGVRGIIECKTTLQGPQEVGEAISKLRRNIELCDIPELVFAGLFVYEPAANQEMTFLKSLVSEPEKSPLFPLKSICYGPDVSVRFYGPLPPPVERVQGWISWDVPGMAPAYFVAALVEHLAKRSATTELNAWYPENPDATPRLYVSIHETEPKLFPPEFDPT